MIYIQFLFFAIIVVLGSTYLSRQAEIIDRNTKLSPALIGIVIALATSLPELATSLTSVYIGSPETAIGNVLGSNAFNFLILGIVSIIFYKRAVYSHVNAITNKVNYYVLLMYGLFTAAYFLADSVFSIGNVSLFSIVILLVYIIAVRNVQEDQKQQTEIEDHDHDPQKARKAYIAFGVLAIIILLASIVLSTTSEQIVEKNNLSASFFGAIFIAITTSLPEMIACFSLVKSHNYNIAATSVLGSNLFNFLILVAVDFFIGTPIYDLADSNVAFLVIIGMAFAIISIIFIKIRSFKLWVNITPGIIMGILYILFLINGVI